MTEKYEYVVRYRFNGEARYRYYIVETPDKARELLGYDIPGCEIISIESTGTTVKSP